MDRQRKLRSVRRIVDVGLRTSSTTVRVRAQLGRSQIRRYDAVYINLYSPTNGSNTKTHGKTAKNLYIYTHTRLTAPCPGLPGWAGTRKVKPIWIFLKQVSGSGIS